MSFGPSGSWLLLDGARLPPALADEAPPVQRAGGFLQAAVLLARERPVAILLDPSIGWHATFARTLPRDRRPALLAVSRQSPGDDVADVWLPATADRAECAEKLSQLERRRAARRGPLDPALTAA